jgi:hypothetical protein
MRKTTPTRPRLYGQKSGVSLLISIGLVAVIIFFSLLVSNIIISSIRQSANMVNANKAYYAAEGALEVGLLDNVNNGAGYTNTEEVLNDVNLKSIYKIQGQAVLEKQIDKYYVLPAPGTGDVGNDCDPLRAITDGYFSYSWVDGQGTVFPIPQESAINHPCNWNKLREGETVSIPLYVSTVDSSLNCFEEHAGSGIYICNPADGAFDLKSVIVKIRTACQHGNEMCTPIGRYTLNVINDGDPSVEFDDTIVDWQIVGTSLDGSKNYVMVPERWYNVWNCEGRCVDDGNSEIYEGLINSKKSSDNEVLHLINGSLEKGIDISSSSSVKNTPFNFIRNLNPWHFGSILRPIDNDKIHKPLLKLSAIRSFKSVTHEKIPYLEYQILIDSSSMPPANVAQIISAEAYSGSFKQSLEAIIPMTSGIVEYVIQQ